MVIFPSTNQLLLIEPFGIETTRAAAEHGAVAALLIEPFGIETLVV